MKYRLRSVLKQIGGALLADQNERVDLIRRLAIELRAREEIQSLLIGKICVQSLASLPEVRSLWDVEFRIFSQFGEDGIIQYLVRHMSVPRQMFIEFGVGNYREANTRFLLMSGGWTGLVMDSSQSNIEQIRRSDLCWKYGLEARCALVSADNVNELILSAGIEGDIGLLSIDVDGNDYWVWKAIEVVQPRIVVCEYNSVFGPNHAITVPYRPDFDRYHAHYSGLFFGASLPALCSLARDRGYQFVGTNSAGVNAFFVKRELASNLPDLGPREGYVLSHIRESRDRDGKLSFVGGPERLRLIEDLEVWELSSGRHVPLKALGIRYP